VAVSIRLATIEDAAAIALVYRPYVTSSRVSFEESAPGPDEMAQRVRGGLHPWFVAEAEGRLLGYAASSAFRTRPAYRWMVETGIYLDPAAWGHGVGRALLGTILDVLERQGFVGAVGAIALPNDASVALHEKLGFVHTGTYHQVGFKLGQWIDVGLWQKELAPRSAKPREPLPFASVGALE